MTRPQTVRWAIADLELFPEDGKRHEIIDGELIVTRAPHWKHQEVSGNIYAELQARSGRTGLGRAAIAPGIIFSTTDSVIPDVVWVGNQNLEESLDESGHLTAAPDGLEVENREKGDRVIRRYQFTH